MNSRHAHLLNRYNTLEYILLGDLRDLLEEGSDQETHKWLVAVLDALLKTLPREFDLEDEDGYMSDVLELHPHWASRVERLHEGHDQLFAKLKKLRARLCRQELFAPIADEVRRDLRDWMRSLQAHNRAEVRLLQTAMNLEVGTGD